MGCTIANLDERMICVESGKLDRTESGRTYWEIERPPAESEDPGGFVDDISFLFSSDQMWTGKEYLQKT